jgi:Ca2+-binding EF-hand superfamily protein
MKSRLLVVPALGAAALLACLSPAPGQPRPQPARAAADGVQDFVFLGEARPVLIRLHVRMDGKALQAAWDDCIDYLFRYLDRDGDGVLSKDEAERAPTVAQLTGGSALGLGGGGGRRGGGDAAPSGPTMADLDADGDGKVTKAELAAYYHKKGFVPFQFSFDAGQANPIRGVAAIFGGRRAEPSVEAVNKAIFDLLDTNKDGKLTREELAAAPAVLLAHDEDEDEMIVPHELVQDSGGGAAGLLGMLAQGRPGGGREAATSSPTLVPLPAPGEVHPDLVKRLRERYVKGARNDDKKLSREDLGLDEATFKSLDLDGDGMLDSAELAGFAKRTPDLELVLRLGAVGAKEARLEVVQGSGRSPLATRLTVKDGLGLLDLGVTRAEVRGSDQGRGGDLGFVGEIVRQQYLAQFSQADTNGDGVLDADEIGRSRQFRNLLKYVDRNGDGKISKEELLAYLDHLDEMQKRTAAGCVTLAVSDQSRGLFDMLDTDRDGRLSVREMRRAPQLLAQLDRAGKGFLTRADVPRTYRLEVRRGPASQGPAGGIAAFYDLYGGGYDSGPAAPQKGPLWFRKMDRNRDGDVSRKEWLFSEELFRKIDTDGDGLISLEEAEKAGELIVPDEDR